MLPFDDVIIMIMKLGEAGAEVEVMRWIDWTIMDYPLLKSISYIAVGQGYVSVMQGNGCYSLVLQALTHWGRDEMNDISQTTFSNVFSSTKMFEFRIKFHWSLFVRDQLTISQDWFRFMLGAAQATSHYLNQWWLDYRRTYASLGLNEFKCCGSDNVRSGWYHRLTRTYNY